MRGPSGSGKSTLVRRLVEPLGAGLPIMKDGRQKPYYTIYLGRVVVLGHYEIKNGGVDTLKSISEAYDLAISLQKKYSVVMEGKCLSDGASNVMRARAAGHDVRALVLDTSVEKCIASVRERGHNIKPASIERVYLQVRRHALAFREAGIPTYEGNRDQCLEQAREWLSLS